MDFRKFPNLLGDRSAWERVRVNYETESDFQHVRKDLPRSTVPILSGHEPVSITGTGDNGKITSKDVGRYLDQRSLKHGGELGMSSDEHKHHIAAHLAHEARYAIRQDGNAIGWYADNLRKAMRSMASLHPEFSKSKTRQSIFKAILAVTSNGAEVNKNFEDAHKLYTAYKKYGRIPTDKKFSGQTGKSINQGLRKLQRLIDDHGEHGTAKFLNTPYTVKELRAMGHKFGGEHGDYGTQGSAVLGPKVGGGFYANLNGNFEPVTMDRWFMRTINRLTGSYTKPDPTKVKKVAARILNAIGDHNQYHGLDRGEVLSDLAHAAEHGELKGAAEKWVKAQEGAYGKTGYQDKTELNKATKRMFVVGNPEAMAPKNGTHRKNIREIVDLVQNHYLKPHGVNISNADLQALLWYHEKNLWKKLGIKGRGSKTADYAMAAKRLLDRERAGEIEHYSWGAQMAIPTNYGFLDHEDDLDQLRHNAEVEKDPDGDMRRFEEFSKRLKPLLADDRAMEEFKKGVRENRIAPLFDADSDESVDDDDEFLDDNYDA